MHLCFIKKPAAAVINFLASYCENDHSRAGLQAKLLWRLVTVLPEDLPPPDVTGPTHHGVGSVLPEATVPEGARKYRLTKCHQRTPEAAASKSPPKLASQTGTDQVISIICTCTDVTSMQNVSRTGHLPVIVAFADQVTCVLST